MRASSADVGGSTPDDVLANQQLVTGVLRAAVRLLRRPEGQVHIALRRTPFYDSWGVDALATACGYSSPCEAILRFERRQTRRGRSHTCTRTRARHRRHVPVPLLLLPLRQRLRRVWVLALVLAL